MKFPRSITFLLAFAIIVSIATGAYSLYQSYKFAWAADIGKLSLTQENIINYQRFYHHYDCIFIISSACAAISVLLIALPQIITAWRTKKHFKPNA